MLSLTEHGTHAQQRAGAFEGIGEAVEGGERLAEGALGRVEVAVDRGEERPAPRRGGEGPGPSLPVGALLPLCEDVASALDSSASTRASIVSGHTGRRVVAADRDEVSGKITQQVGGSVAIAEHQLDAPEHRNHLDFDQASRSRLCPERAYRAECAGVVHQSEICLDERLADDEPPVVNRLALLAGDGGFTREVESVCPPTGEPLDEDEHPEQHHAGVLVAAGRRLARQLLQERARLLDLTHSHLLSGERAAGTVEEFEPRGARARSAVS